MTTTMSPDLTQEQVRDLLLAPADASRYGMALEILARTGTGSTPSVLPFRTLAERDIPRLAELTMPADRHPPEPQNYGTIEVATLLRLSVRSVQLMVDRGVLEAWKTPGGHRRISRASVDRWRADNGHDQPGTGSAGAKSPTVLLIDDSIHFQKLVSLLMRQHLPKVELQIADDGIAGLALYGRLQPQVLIVDILLPGIDGATLITSLRSHPQFAKSRLVVVTSLDEHQRAPYAFALTGVPVIHKPRLVAELPALLAGWLLSPARAARRRV